MQIACLYREYSIKPVHVQTVVLRLADGILALQQRANVKDMHLL
jgi:hypothetical protein